MLLKYSMVAGPLYILIGILQMLIRPGFDPTQHDWSLLSNGSLGWIQIANFIVTGILTILGAVGMKKTLTSGKGKTWGPLLLGLYGLGLIGAGIFIADPMNGFPPEMASAKPIISTHGILHLVSGTVGFLGLIAGCIIFSRRFASLHEKSWSRFSLITGIIYLFAFIGIASGSQQGGAVLKIVTIAFTIAVILGWTWISLLSHKLMQKNS
jgi:hypothetical membrane protein